MTFKNKYDLATLPAWQPHDSSDNLKYPHPGQLARWSGRDTVATPPAIGARVDVPINGFGPGEVLAYFIEHGFLGVKVRPDKRPAWHVEQNPGRDFCLVYGNEIKLLKPATEITVSVSAEGADILLRKFAAGELGQLAGVEVLDVVKVRGA